MEGELSKFNIIFRIVVQAYFINSGRLKNSNKEFPLQFEIEINCIEEIAIYVSSLKTNNSYMTTQYLIFVFYNFLNLSQYLNSISEVS